MVEPRDEFITTGDVYGEDFEDAEGTEDTRA